MQNYLIIAQIVVSIALVLTILLQVRGGGLGGIFGQADTVYRTKRGVEKTLFQFTIILVVIFVAISLVLLKLGPMGVS
jgi:preprotein translocase subunit SecG